MVEASFGKRSEKVVNSIVSKGFTIQIEDSALSLDEVVKSPSHLGTGEGDTLINANFLYKENFCPDFLIFWHIVALQCWGWDGREEDKKERLYVYR